MEFSVLCSVSLVLLGLVAVESPDIALSLVGGGVMPSGGKFFGVRSLLAAMI
ncbi:hypothetical protein IQ270_28385 [Microcoleus sp. LEGE 07076]|uniref:hypothetical protein n=1 Tax=Microcoleus sp. LEGE 07076 TaxID=915322 RepID=UPI001881786A|nr:hypothetical protein [Microcoleus sp. LEGE 07076]MBE9188447.1 hypothetical protein [Microcoleus sp. LEGE 07076]